MQLIDLATISKKHFHFFVEKCNQTYRSGHALAYYRDLIAMHRQSRSLETLIDNDQFLIITYRTLEEWDMNKRRAKLAPFQDFKKSVITYKEQLLKLYTYKLYDDIYDDLSTIKPISEIIFSNLNVMLSNRKIVGVSKALHFLLPDLIMPIDSKYTMMAFYGYNKYSNSTKKEFETFWDIISSTYDIAGRLKLSPHDADGVLWKQSIPKLIDNAIIGMWNSDKEEILSLCDSEPSR
ncbi:hypothetical protein [Geobacter pickeringii]|nr:hypothetical protein [Geobacter pickeringii]